MFTRVRPDCLAPIRQASLSGGGVHHAYTIITPRLASHRNAQQSFLFTSLYAMYNQQYPTRGASDLLLFWSHMGNLSVFQPNVTIQEESVSQAKRVTQ